MEREAVSALSFDRTPIGPPGALTRLSARVRRIVAPNPGPMTFTGTCTYIVGEGEVVVIDPGPDLAEHVTAVIEALRQEHVAQILITHSHRDHSGAAPALQAATGAPVVGGRPVHAAAGEGDDLESAHDPAYAPDRVLADGEAIAIKDVALTAVATPGHTGNHLSFALAQEAALFSGDHVMAWSTSVVIPPDGAMGDYMASLAKLQNRSEHIYFPGHGAPVYAPQAYLSALIAHRRQREAAILAALEETSGRESTLPQLVAVVYRDVDPILHPAASHTLRAHLNDLVARGLVQMDGPAGAPTYRAC